MMFVFKYLQLIKKLYIISRDEREVYTYYVLPDYYISEFFFFSVLFAVFFLINVSRHSSYSLFVQVISLRFGKILVSIISIVS